MVVKIDDIRHNGRIDINEGIALGAIKIDTAEREGSREKFWSNNEILLTKIIKKDTLEDYGEIIGMELAKFLGIETAHYDFATYNGQNAVVTLSVLEDDEILVSGVEIINDVEEYVLRTQGYCKSYYEILNKYGIDDIKNLNKYDKNIKMRALYEIIMLVRIAKVKTNYTTLDSLKLSEVGSLSEEIIDEYLFLIDEIFIDINDMYQEDFILWTNNTHECNNLFDMWAILDAYIRRNKLIVPEGENILEGLAQRFLFDILTLQGDRHASNWSLIKNKNTNEIRLAPLYDSANCFYLAELNSFKEINNTIKKLENPSIDEKKKEKMKQQIKALMNKSRAKLRYSRDDFDKKVNNTDMIREFFRETDPSQYEEIVKRIMCLTPENIEQIFTKIEKNGITIPIEVKNVVKATLAEGVKEVKEALNKGVSL